jgi:hypothetical protein
MDIANKWKHFAMGSLLSDWSGDTVEVFDRITAAETSEQAQALFDEYQIDIWQPFEWREPLDMADMILNLAHNAQQVENEK